MTLASSQAPLHGGTQTPSGISHKKGTGKLTFSSLAALATVGINKKNMANGANFFIFI
jgi:hypothetical protein